VRIILGLIIVLCSAIVFCAASLLPNNHLVDAPYLIRFAQFATLLACGAFIIITVLQMLIKNKILKNSTAVLVSLLVFTPVYFWNAKPSPNVILLVLDSLRADHMGCYGYSKDTTPNLDRFALDAVKFETCYSQSAGTDKSLPAIFASIYPSMFYNPATDKSNFFVPDKFSLLSQQMKKLGYDTWGFSANPHISKAMNYHRGYDEFIEFWREDCRPENLGAYFTEKVEASKNGKFLLAGLVIDPHTPYTPMPKFNIFANDKTKRFKELLDIGMKTNFPIEIANMLRDLYDGEIREVDHSLGSFLDWMKEKGFYDNSMIIITSDHGEAFKEHGLMGHGGLVYEERIHIPLLIRFPSPIKYPELRPAKSFNHLVSQVDYMPTILGFLGSSSDRGPAQGQNLIPMIFNKETTVGTSAQDVLIEELAANQAIRCLRTVEWKMIVEEAEGKNKRYREYLFNMSNDPGEKTNLADKDEFGPIKKALIEEIKKRVGKLKQHYKSKDSNIQIDDHTKKKLDELGYGAGG